MKKLDNLHLQHASQSEQIMLQQWLDEWNTAAVLERQPDTDGTTERATARPAHGHAAVPTLINAFDADVANGQVRLLSPAICAATARRPLHIAVLRAKADARHLVAPFSRFATPAMPDELGIEGRAPALSAVELWNTRTLPDTLLSLSWVVDEFDPCTLSSCLAVYSRFTHESELPDALQGRVGPPLTHPLDPRHDYRAEETAAMDMLVEAANSLDRAITYAPPASSGLRKAAEERDAYGDRDTPRE